MGAARHPVGPLSVTAASHAFAGAVSYDRAANFGRVGAALRRRRTARFGIDAAEARRPPVLPCAQVAARIRAPRYADRPVLAGARRGAGAPRPPPIALLPAA